MNIKTTVHMSLLAATLAASFQAMAADPAVVFDMGGKFDKSFNQAAYTGIEKWKKETGKKYLSFEVTNPSQREQAIREEHARGLAEAEIARRRLTIKDLFDHWARVEYLPMVTSSEAIEKARIFDADGFNTYFAVASYIERGSRKLDNVHPELSQTA